MGQQGGPGWSQASTRHPQKFTDQHGRKWYATVENANGYPVGAIEPQFQAPWFPDQQYLWIDPEDMSRVVIQYDRMITDLRNAHTLYWKEGVRVCTRNRWEVPKKRGEMFEGAVIEIIGEPPRPLEPAIAAKQGNKWILGVTRTPDLRLAKFFEAPTDDDDLDFSDEDDFSGEDDTALTELYPPAAVDEELLEELEEEHDPDALGGRKVATPSQQRKRQAAKRGKSRRTAAAERAE